MSKKWIFLLGLGVSFLFGANNLKKECIIDSQATQNCILKLEVRGVGVVPCSGACSVAQARMMARRAAIIDGYKSLTEKLYGIKINGRDSVKNMILQSSVVRSYVEGLIRGANIEDEEFKDGVYQVVMSMKIDVKKWNEFIKNCKDCSFYFVNDY